MCELALSFEIQLPFWNPRHRPRPFLFLAHTPESESRRALSSIANGAAAPCDPSFLLLPSLALSCPRAATVTEDNAEAIWSPLCSATGASPSMYLPSGTTPRHDWYHIVGGTFTPPSIFSSTSIAISHNKLEDPVERLLNIEPIH